MKKIILTSTIAIILMIICSQISMDLSNGTETNTSVSQTEDASTNDKLAGLPIRLRKRA